MPCYDHSGYSSLRSRCTWKRSHSYHIRVFAWARSSAFYSFSPAPIFVLCSGRVGRFGGNLPYERLFLLIHPSSPPISHSSLTRLFPRLADQTKICVTGVLFSLRLSPLKHPVFAQLTALMTCLSALSLAVWIDTPQPLIAKKLRRQSPKRRKNHLLLDRGLLSTKELDVLDPPYFASSQSRNGQRISRNSRLF